MPCTESTLLINTRAALSPSTPETDGRPTSKQSAGLSYWFVVYGACHWDVEEHVALTEVKGRDSHGIDARLWEDRGGQRSQSLSETVSRMEIKGRGGRKMYRKLLDRIFQHFISHVRSKSGGLLHF